MPLIGAQRRPDPASRRDPEDKQRDWEDGYRTGRRWALDEAEAGRLHPVELPDGSAARARMLIEHAQQVFGGLCRGRSRPFIRGFVQAVADVWREVKNRP